MIALIQRVSSANVVVGTDIIGSIGRGILAFIGIEKGDSEADARRLFERIVGYRV